MSKHEESSQDVNLSAEQLAALERIATTNQIALARLISLAVNALVAEAARHEGWLPVPKRQADGSVAPQQFQKS